MGRSDRRFVALAGALATAALACNAIVGLSDYERGECSGGGVCADAGATDAPADAPIDVVERVDASGSRPVSWARFKMPNYAQDGGPTKYVQSSTTYAPAAGGHFDTITELTWRDPMPEADETNKSWEEAQRICATMTEGGGKWRLPSRIELVTLLDLSRSPKKIDPTFTARGGQYWTTSEVRPLSAGGRERWTVGFESGGLGKSSESSGKAAVRCILDAPSKQ